MKNGFFRFRMPGRVVFAACHLLAIGALAGPVGSIFDPRGTALGTVSASHTNLTFDTGTGEWWLDGVLQSSIAPLETNESGSVAMRVYRFSAFDSSGISNIVVEATESDKPGLIIASRRDLTMASVLNLSGTDAVVGVAGKGGPGAEGGVAETADGNLGSESGTKSSSPPGASGGNGGLARSHGTGYGGGGGSLEGNYAAGGGAYGGQGGNGDTRSGNSLGGVPYGDALLTNLFGGSGGGGARIDSESGGGGGGSLGLIALGAVRISGTLALSGGRGRQSTHTGGGGSGGGVLVAAAAIDISGGSIDVSGGFAGDGSSWVHGGGGGGGRIAFYSNTPVQGLENFMEGSNQGEDAADNIDLDPGPTRDTRDRLATPGTFESQAGAMPFRRQTGTVFRTQ